MHTSCNWLISSLHGLGVVTYVVLSGASPFLDESLEETCLNICRLDFSFPEDYFQGVSAAARDFVCLLLQSEPERRPSAASCLREPWLQPRGVANTGSATFNHTQASQNHPASHLDTSRLISFIERRKHQNDVRPVDAIKAFLHSRLLNHIWWPSQWVNVTAHAAAVVRNSCLSVKLQRRTKNQMTHLSERTTSNISTAITLSLSKPQKSCCCWLTDLCWQTLWPSPTFPLTSA